MVLPGNIVPPDAGWVAREIQALKTGLREGLASIAKSFSPQVEFLLGQKVFAEAVPGSLTVINTDPATADVPVTWVPYDPVADATVTLITSSTGRLSFVAGGYIWLRVTNLATQWGFIGVEVLDSLGTVIRNPGVGDGNLQALRVQSGVAVNANSGHEHTLNLSPRATYVLRCRRGYQIDGAAGGTAQVAFQGTALSATKLGM